LATEKLLGGDAERLVCWGMVLVDDGRYEGDYRDGKRHGRGVYVFANGDKCEGDWRGNKLLGTGEGWQIGQPKKCYEDDGTIKFTD